MSQPSIQASNFLIFLTYGIFLILGLYLALRLRNQSKTEWLSANGTQTAIPLALNFIASALGSGILFSYPQLATITGIQGVATYAITTSAPLLLFAYVGPILRRKCPNGFVLTEWIRQRYGTLCSLYLSFLTMITMFLYMVAELSALQQITTVLTGIDGLRFVIVQCIITTVYTSLGGFQISFISDNVQGTMVLGILLIATATIGFKTRIDQNLVDASGLTKPTLLGWQLLYILPVAVLSNDFFLSSFWIRTFASKSDRDLWVGVLIATVMVLIILTLVGTTGLIAIWTGAFDPSNPEQDSNLAFFYLLDQLPSWTIGMVLVMTVTLSTAAFDSLQSAMVSTASNDIFRNKINIWWARLAVVIIILPVIMIALKAPSILQIYLISDLISASTIPISMLGLSEKFRFLEGPEVMIGGLGGLLTVFLFGTAYYGNVRQGVQLLLLGDGLYTGDWSVFGAFVAAPFGGLICGLSASCVRYGFKIGKN